MKHINNHIFISYSRKNEAVVDAFSKRLRYAGFSVWQDKSGAGNGIPFSTKWFDTIREALYLSGAAIIFRSDYWNNSANCAKEFELIEKCAIPRLFLDPEETERDPEGALNAVRTFCREKVDTMENSIRAKLFSAAYEIKEGRDPHQIIGRTKGFFLLKLFHLTTVNTWKKQMKAADYERLNPEIYPYMEKFIRFARSSILWQAGWIVLGLLTAAAATAVIQAGGEALRVSAQRNPNAYNGMAVSGQMADLRETDPVMAIQKAVTMAPDYLQPSSYLTLNMNAVRLNNAVLPVSVAKKGSRLYHRIVEEEPVLTGKLYTAEPLSDSGGILLTRLSDGLKWTVNSPGTVSCISWSRDGKHLAFASGSRVFVYDPAGYGDPISLAENYEQVESVRFIAEEGRNCVAALTERETVLLWEDPIEPEPAGREGIYYGVFLKDQDKPAAVYADENEIVISRDHERKTLISFREGELLSTGLAVMDDRMAAVIYDRDGISHVLCIDLENGTTERDIRSDYRLTGLAVSADGKSLYASALGCTAAIIEPDSGCIRYGGPSRSSLNIVRWGDKYILTDQYGQYMVMDGDMNVITGFGRTNYAYMPCFAMAVAEKKGFLFTVNRGGASTLFCEKIDLNDSGNGTGTDFGMINFLVPEMDKVDANTAVAVSSDEKYVAFGYPNGVIRIYETAGQAYMAAELQSQNCSVSALKFSPDDTVLYVLSEMGGLHSLKVSLRGRNTDPDDMQASWQMITDELMEKYNTYHDGLPTD